MGSSGATVRDTAEEEPVELNDQEQRDRSQYGATSSGNPSLTSFSGLPLHPALASIIMGTTFIIVSCSLSSIQM